MVRDGEAEDEETDEKQRVSELFRGSRRKK